MMEINMKKKKTKKVLYNVQCAFDEKHVFEKVLEVEVGTESVESEVDAFCPSCNKMVSIMVKGKVAMNTSVMRGTGS
jgi:hypothetical protein